MVVGNCEITHLGDKNPRNIKGHLTYGRGMLGGGTQPYIFDTNFEGFTAFECGPEDLVPVDPNNLEKSLTSAYKKSRILGKFNPFLKIPLPGLKQEYSQYEAHFKEYLAKEN